MKMFEWEQDEGMELTIPSINGSGLDVQGIDANENALRMARAEQLASQAQAGIALLRDIAATMAKQTNATAPMTYSLADLDGPSRELVLEVLGKGEVSGHMSQPEPVQIQESIFPGLWLLKSLSRPENPEVLVIGDVPPVMRIIQEIENLDTGMTIPADVENTMNALPVLAEIKDRAQDYRHGHTNHVINFTLLPMSEQDMALLRETLGAGHIDLTSTGYGACRVCSTRWPHVWSVQFFNSMDKVILDTLEIGGVPNSVCASQEDFQDSAERIIEVIEAYL